MGDNTSLRNFFDILLHTVLYVEEPEDEHGTLQCYAAILSPAVNTQADQVAPILSFFFCAVSRS